MAGEQFSLCWDNFHKNMSNGMHALLENEDLVDVTIAVEGKYIKAHKMVLSVCSPYFKELFQTNPCKHPIVFMKDVNYIAMNDLLTFMYQGEVQVNQEHLTAFIKTAEALQIKGLTGDSTVDNQDLIEETYQSEEVTIRPMLPESKHKLRKLVQSGTKRPRLSSNSEKVLPATEEIIQFKMEPFDTEQHSQEINESYENLEEVQGEPYREIGPDDPLLEDTNIDDPEDYSMLEGEDEAKPGTSNEVGVESQDKTKKHRVRTVQEKIIMNGFVYHTSVVRYNPAVRYLVCSKYTSAGCHGRAILPLHADVSMLRITQEHNHPPDNSIEEKNSFLNRLKMAVQHTPQAPLKQVFDNLIDLYPRMASEFSFDSLRSSLRRWRKLNK